MAHPYLTRRAQVIGFFSLLLVFAAAWAVVARALVAAAFVGVGAAVLLALAIYSQIRFGPRISEVPRNVPWPPNSFHGWFGVFMFILAIIGMAVVVLWSLLHGHKI